MKHIPLEDVLALQELRCRMLQAGQQGDARLALDLADACLSFVQAYGAGWDLEWRELDALTSPYLLVGVPGGSNAAPLES